MRTAVGRYGGGLASVRTDDLAAVPLKALQDRHIGVDWEALDDVIMGCANQAGEDNRNVARMALLLAGLPVQVPGVTVNRLCGSGLDAVGQAARAIMAGEAEFINRRWRGEHVALALRHAQGRVGLQPQGRDLRHQHRLAIREQEAARGLRHRSHARDGREPGQRVRHQPRGSGSLRLHSQEKAAAAQADGSLARQIVPVLIPQRKADPVCVDRDEHPRLSSLEKLAALCPAFRADGTVTAGNASGW